MRVAYLVSLYPAVSHTFIQREVLALRRLGWTIDTFSVRRCDRRELLSDADLAAFETTYSILPPDIGHLLVAHGIALLTRPRRYASSLRLALRLSPGGGRDTLWQVFYFVEAVVLWHQCQKRGIRHIHAHFANVGSDVALLAADLGGAGSRADDWSWSFTMHGSTEFYDVAKHRLSQKVEHASFVICISDFCRSQLMGFVDEEHWPKLRVIRCGVDIEAFTPPVRRWDDSLDRGRRTVRVLSVGRLTQAKGLVVFLHAVAELVERGLAIEATIIGDGPKRAALDELAHRLGITERVSFEGALGQDAIRDHYEAADVFCLPSFAEGVPVVLMEAMATGLPVVTTRIMGTPELVEDQVSGLLVSPGRADQLAVALAEVVTAPDRREAMGRAGRKKVCAEFDLQRSARQVHEAFFQSLGGVHACVTGAAEPDRLGRLVGAHEP